MTDEQLERLIEVIGKISEGPTRGPTGLELKEISIALAGEGLQNPIGEKIENLSSSLDNIADAINNLANAVQNISVMED